MLLPAATLAQSRAFAVWERPAAGVTIGSSANGDHDSGDHGPDFDFVFDTPVVFGYRLRADVSRVGWQFESRAAAGLPAFETVTLKSIRLGLLGVRHAGPRLAGYAGGGFGAYRYEFERTPLHHPWRGGVHGVAGLEITSQSQRYACIGEVRLHAINGVRQPPSLSYTLFKGDAAIGMKMRF